MKKTRWKNIVRGIKGSLNRFLSILFIVALGSGFMAGLAAASPDMYDTADEYIKEYNLFDIDIKSTIGMTDDDLTAIKNLDETSQIQGSVVFDMVLDQGEGSEFTSRVYGIFDNDGNTALNQVNLIDGRLPENSSECVIESVFGKYSGEGISIGDTLTLSETNTNYSTLEGYMAGTELTVVGICQSPMCLSIEGDTTNIGSGTINLNVYVRNDFYTCDFYTDLFLTIAGASDLNAFEDPYSNLIDSAVDDIKAVSDELVNSRVSSLTDDINEQIDSINRLKDIFDDAAAAQEDLNSDLALRISQTEEAAGILGDHSYLTELLAQTAETAGAAASQDHSDSSDVSDENAETGSGDEASSEFLSTADLIAELDSDLADAEDYLDSLSDASWIIRTRDDLAGFYSYSSNVGKVSALAKIFPVFFFIVALLVALTTLSRLIEENRLQIGTLKALGYSNAQILFEYMLFSFAASVLGCVLGFGVGFWVFPKAISSAYAMMYTLPATMTPVRWDIVAWVAPVTIISILLAALWSCWNEFRSVPAVLMLPKSPAAGKRIWLEHIGFIWRRLSFTYKVTFRNLFRYKKRFIMTIIGVAGCSALLLTGFGIKDSVNDIVDRQYGQIYKYDMIFAMDEDGAIEKDDELKSLISDKDTISSYALAAQENGKIYYGKEKQELSLFVPEDLDTLSEFITLRNRRSGDNISLSSDGVILTEKMCEEMNIQAGDTVTLEDADGHQCSVTVAAITENYVSSYAYMTADVYESCFGSQPQYTYLLCRMASASDAGSNSSGSASDDAQSSTDRAAEITEDILATSHILYGRSVANLKDSFSDSIESINGVIYVLIVAAGLLCIVVLYNLTNVNICERRKELATLRVLGFYRNETQNYIFRETNILSFLGAIAGLGVGIWLHSVVVKTVEVNHIMFGRDIKPLSYVIALAISVVFTLIVDLIMKRPINKTDMVEAMKAND